MLLKIYMFFRNLIIPKPIDDSVCREKGYHYYQHLYGDVGTFTSSHSRFKCSGCGRYSTPEKDGYGCDDALAGITGSDIFDLERGCILKKRTNIGTLFNITLKDPNTSILNDDNILVEEILGEVDECYKVFIRN